MNEDRRQNDTEILAALGNIQTSVTRLDGRVTTLHVKLLGEETGENPEGRLPRLEARTREHGRSIGHLKKWAWIAYGAIILAGFMVHALVDVYARSK